MHCKDGTSRTAKRSTAWGASQLSMGLETTLEHQRGTMNLRDQGTMGPNARSLQGMPTKAATMQCAKIRQECQIHLVRFPFRKNGAPHQNLVFAGGAAVADMIKNTLLLPKLLKAYRATSIFHIKPDGVLDTMMLEEMGP